MTKSLTAWGSESEILGGNSPNSPKINTALEWFHFSCWCHPAVQHLTPSAGGGRQGQSIKPGKKAFAQRRVSFWVENPSLQTSNQAFLTMLTAVLQLKNTQLAFQAHRKCVSCQLKVGMTHTYANENEEQPRGFAGRIFKE